MKFRYERKVGITETDEASIIHFVKLHPFGFREIFQQRRISNIYFDTPDYQFLYENINGDCNRLKLRARWYGELCGTHTPVLEQKIKKGLVGTKKSFPLHEIEIKNNCQWSGLFKYQDGETCKADKVLLRQTIPTLYNTYERKYFLCAQGKIRITIDKNLAFIPLRKGSLHSTRPQRLHHVIVLEVKYDKGNESYANKVLSHFPIGLTKFSKYSEGLRCFL